MDRATVEKNWVAKITVVRHTNEEFTFCFNNVVFNLS